MVDTFQDLFEYVSQQPGVDPAHPGDQYCRQIIDCLVEQGLKFKAWELTETNSWQDSLYDAKGGFYAYSHCIQAQGQPAELVVAVSLAGLPVAEDAAASWTVKLGIYYQHSPSDLVMTPMAPLITFTPLDQWNVFELVRKLSTKISQELTR